MTRRSWSRVRRAAIAVMLVLGAVILLLVLGERPHSFVKVWLYEGGATRELTVGAVTLRPDKDPEATLARLAEQVAALKRSHPEVDLILFGEVILGWYQAPSPDYHRSIARPIPGPITEAVGRLAREHGVYISFGMVETGPTLPYNTQVTLDRQGRIVDVRRKKHVRSPNFTEGQETVSFIDVDGIRTAVIVCADAQSDEATARVEQAGADLVLVSLADYSEPWDNDRVGLSYGARRFHAWMVTANRFGDENDTHWDGHLEVLDPFGQVVAAGRGEEQVLVETLSIKAEHSPVRHAGLVLYTRLSAVWLVLGNLRTALGYL
jgi:predicted amidohydrolase